MRSILFSTAALCAALLLSSSSYSQLGKRFPSERKVVKDPVTGTMLTFLTSTPAGDSKIYPTHPQWTSDGQWLIFRSSRVPGQAMAVNERTGDLVQVTEGGYSGTLCIAQKSMKLFIMRPVTDASARPAAPEGKRDATSGSDATAARGPNRPRTPMQIVEINLERLLADSARGSMSGSRSYERICGTIPAEIGANSDMAIDATEE